MQLYYAAGACSLAPHIVLEETGAAYQAVPVALAQGEQRTPAYLRINPKGKVPTLIDAGRVITENPAILRYLARKFPAARLWPDDDALLEAACVEWLSWLATTIHVHFAHIRRPERYAGDEAARTAVVAKGKEVCDLLWRDVDARLAGRTWAIGDRYSVADAHLLVFWTWGRGPSLGFDMPAKCPNWTAHALRMAERPAVQRTFAQEGLTLPA
jgi:glutathione S-transferase